MLLSLLLIEFLLVPLLLLIMMIFMPTSSGKTMTTTTHGDDTDHDHAALAGAFNVPLAAPNDTIGKTAGLDSALHELTSSIAA